ncbi:hypothetical protein [Allorhodopirellula solitaria]|uniref:hypothetical protein n=1 Tax=Allorhodopirellula solitaria TaxID=2527987 RepID=UPI001FE27C77|nr:hypothetical protein [Allorhodopirellula solitaria]
MSCIFAPSRFSRSAAVAVVALSTFATAQLPLRSVSAQDKQPISAGETVAAPAVTDPVVVVTVGSVNQMTQDLNYLTGALGQPQVGGMFAMMAGTFTQGIDTSQPVGVLVPLVDGAPEPIALIPTADVKTVLKRLEDKTGPADELDDGTLVVAVGANTIFIRQVGNWAVLARNRRVLDQAPADPSSVIAQMGADYDLAVRLDMQQIPNSVREALVAQIRQGFDQAMSQQQGEDAESTRQYAQQSMDQLEQMISQTDDVMFGIDIDSAGKRIVLDGSFTALPGTKLAAMYADQKPIPSAFSMVVRDDAAGYFHFASSISPQAVEDASAGVDSMLKMVGQAFQKSDKLDETEAKNATEVVNRIAELVLATYQDGKVDAGAVLLTDAGSMKFVMGGYVADGAEAAAILQDIASKAEGHSDAPRFEFDRETYNGVKMHLIAADVPEKDDEVRKIFGDTVRVHIGTADKAVYVALGDQSVPLMKELIDSAATPSASAATELARFEINLMPILQYTQSVEANDGISSMIDALSRADDPGTLRAVSEPIDNGQSTRVVLRDGLLRAIGGAIRQAQAQQMQQQNSGQF